MLFAHFLVIPTHPDLHTFRQHILTSSGPEGFPAATGPSPSRENPSILDRASSLAGSLSARFRQGVAGSGGGGGGGSEGTPPSIAEPSAFQASSPRVGTATADGSLPPPPFGQAIAAPAHPAPATTAARTSLSSFPLVPGGAVGSTDMESGTGGHAAPQNPAYGAPDVALAAAQQVRYLLPKAGICVPGGPGTVLEPQSGVTGFEVSLSVHT